MEEHFSCLLSDLSFPGSWPLFRVLVSPYFPSSLPGYFQSHPLGLYQGANIYSLLIMWHCVWRGKVEKARETLIYLRQAGPESVDRELKEIETINKEGLYDEVKSLSTKTKMLLEKSSLIPMTIVVFLFAAQSFCGSNMVNYYMVSILQVPDITWPEDDIHPCLVDGGHSYGWESCLHHDLWSIHHRLLILINSNAQVWNWIKLIFVLRPILDIPGEFSYSYLSSSSVSQTLVQASSSSLKKMQKQMLLWWWPRVQTLFTIMSQL